MGSLGHCLGPFVGHIIQHKLGTQHRCWLRLGMSLSRSTRQRGGFCRQGKSIRWLLLAAAALLTPSLRGLGHRHGRGSHAYVMHSTVQLERPLVVKGARFRWNLGRKPDGPELRPVLGLVRSRHLPLVGLKGRHFRPFGYVVQVSRCAPPEG
ncbi:hypothetical protein IWX49DRAFT_585151 [Phyllosticta citricarpa]